MEDWNIRKQNDSVTGKLYFSIVDIIGLTTSSTNPRNYWKVLKNRLKKERNELVTRCNQLKMRARDGKNYLTDVADAETIFDILKLVPNIDRKELDAFFKPLLPKILDTNAESAPKREKEKGGEKHAVLLTDAYLKDDYIYVEAMVAGVSPTDLNISVQSRSITIEGKREYRDDEQIINYMIQELFWSSFSRTLVLPRAVDPKQVQINISAGHLIICAPIIK